jgi:hypothetical protein
LLAVPLLGQSPVKLEFACTPEDVDRFGLTCSPEEPCPVYLELAHVASVAARLVVTGNLHSSTVTMYSILLASEDGGTTWNEPFSRQPFGSLDQIQFFDLESGWVSGHLVQPTPKDPFLLLTRDGGKTWRKQALFEEARPGAIDQFWFDSKTNGSLVFSRGSRYELYETQTGGDSWNVKQAGSAPVRLKQPPPSGSWRLQPHAASKTVRLERRAGEKWEPVASFIIHVGDCK